MRKQYSREFKVEAVRLSYEEGQTIAKVAKQLGIPRSSLGRWRSAYKKDPEGSFPGKGNLNEKDAEIARLKKALREAEMKVEILKKATAIFAQPSR